MARIRHANSDSGGSRKQDYQAVPRRYDQQGLRSITDRLQLFISRLEDYGCVVHRCREDGIYSLLNDVLGDRGVRDLVVTEDVPSGWLPNGFRYFQDFDLTYEEINATDGVISRCALAIAETGTIVLRHSRQEGRRALTLIPDYHLCAVFEEQVVELVPEALAAMAGFAEFPITTVSGPSATSDIEMTRIEGVHGPRTLEVLLVAP